MIVQEGKFYKTRDGRKVGPARLHSHTYGYWDLGKEFDAFHEANGSYFPGGADISPDDLIAEWTEGPVRTVTRREVVEGRYACVDVGHVIDVSDASPVRKVAVALYGYRSSAELKAAAAVLLELAGALDDGK